MKRFSMLYLPVFQTPWCDELGEAITPDVLVHRDADEQTSCDRLVAVDSIRRDDGWQRSDLDTSEGKAQDDNCLPWPLAIITHGHDDVAQVHDDHVGDHRRQAHLRFSDSSVSLRRAHADPV